MAVIGVEPAVKYSFVLKGMQTRRKVQCRIDPFASFVCQTTDNSDNSYFKPRLLKLWQRVFLMVNSKQKQFSAPRRLKAKIKGAFSLSYCCYGNIVC